MAKQTLDEQTVAALDKLFNAWLALNGLVSKGGVLYLADNFGNILCDEQKRQKKADPQQFRALIADPDKGFQAYTAKKGMNISLMER